MTVSLVAEIANDPKQEATPKQSKKKQTHYVIAQNVRRQPEVIFNWMR